MTGARRVLPGGFQRRQPETRADEQERCVANIELRLTGASHLRQPGGDSEEALDELRLPYRVRTCSASRG